MYSGDRDALTICAVSTPPGRGGISVIRVSGVLVLTVLPKVLKPAPREIESHRVYYGHFIHPESGLVLDEVLVSFFRKGRSFTGEDVMEISCHGNPVICDSILQALIASGCQMALPGEFTFRAFMNDRLDLVQAEAVLSVIEGRSQKSVQRSLLYLGGVLSKNLKVLQDELTRLLAHVEASIDFSSEGLEILSAEELESSLIRLEERLRELILSYDQSRGLREGFRGLFCGRPNVGKSSLFNLVVGEDRSIVTPVAGTTRDILEGEAFDQGQRFCLFDTAGLRCDTSDQIEILGQERVWASLPRMDFALYVIDNGVEMSSEDDEYIRNISNNKIPLMILRNKVDQGPWDKKTHRINGVSYPVLNASAHSDGFREQFWASLHELLMGANVEDEAVLFSARQKESLVKAADCLIEALNISKSGVGSEFLALPLMEGLKALHSLLGLEFDDAVMDKVFREFCLGK